MAAETPDAYVTVPGPVPADIPAVVDPAEWIVHASSGPNISIVHSKCADNSGYSSLLFIGSWPTLADVLTAVTAHKCPEAR